MYHCTTLSYDRSIPVQNNIIYVEKEIKLWEPIHTKTVSCIGDQSTELKYVFQFKKQVYTKVGRENMCNLNCTF